MSAHIVLKRIVEEKKAGNPRMSLRWIAAKMGISSGRLSEILNGKRPLTEYYADKFCLALKLSEDQVRELRRAHQAPTQKDSFGPVLNENVVEQLADWKPFALLSFFQTTLYLDIVRAHNTQQTQTNEIARRFALPVEEVESLLTAMSVARLAEWDGGQWRAVHGEATTGYDIPSDARRRGHIRDLELAQQKLNSVSIYDRDFSSMKMTMDPQDINKAKKLIREFRRSFVRTMEKGKKKGVFQINIQLLPLVMDTTEGAPPAAPGSN